ncbi:hypothetical protein ABZZ20_11660 [Streptomyces sp. NPDC006430]|uniref:DUF7674 family protein n=1 Tax=Streptomyces sp. NPDC006430 TaxID=3154299 RepID=UPI0033BE52EC
MAMPPWWHDLLAVSDELVIVDDDLPPTFLLAKFGEVFAAHASELTHDHRRRVLNLLEQVLTDGTEKDQALVATGFLEALLNAWDEGFELRTVWDDLGPESQAHCLAWNKFAGVDSPDWMRLR